MRPGPNKYNNNKDEKGTDGRRNRTGFQHKF